LVTCKITDAQMRKKYFSSKTYNLALHHIIFAKIGENINDIFSCTTVSCTDIVIFLRFVMLVYFYFAI